ncbi:MAG: [Fe-Fe] hydrogenase large subunit C-terminal domain-containing protein [bacterium]
MSDNTFSLPAIVDVDSDKCVQCHACIQVCPVKYCNDASDLEKGITVNHDLCIGCGNCIRACTHDARYIIDDTEQFMEDLKKGEKIACLVAPAAAVNFPGQLHNLLSWLKSIGVQKNFDVSFGAEITTYQYLQAYKKGANTPIIAQPCPAVVNFIEIYKPHLIKYLAPTGSPVMDIACWVHKHHPGYKLAFISPCIAKKREFTDPKTKNRIQYNVTIANLKKYMDANNIALSSFPQADFDGPMEAERGLLYSQPGGLYETFKRYNVPLKLHQVRRTEGVEIYEEFFEELEKEIESGKSEVVLVDILNCLHGCNRGTGTIYDERTTDEILKIQDDRLEEHKKKNYSTDQELDNLEKLLQSMEDIDFSREYSDKSENFTQLEDPDEEGIKALYEEMYKFEPEDIKNCACCGYMSCEAMAKAILNGLYRPQQCHHFLEVYYRRHSKDEE